MAFIVEVAARRVEPIDEVLHEAIGLAVEHEVVGVASERHSSSTESCAACVLMSNALSEIGSPLSSPAGPRFRCGRRIGRVDAEVDGERDLNESPPDENRNDLLKLALWSPVHREVAVTSMPRTDRDTDDVRAQTPRARRAASSRRPSSPSTSCGKRPRRSPVLRPLPALPACRSTSTHRAGVSGTGTSTRSTWSRRGARTRGRTRGTT